MKQSEWKDNLKTGDPIIVKKGTICPDFNDLDIGGWKGVVTEIAKDDDGNILICIEWNDATKQNMPEKFLQNGEEEGLDNDSMYLSYEDIELIKI